MTHWPSIMKPLAVLWMLLSCGVPVPAENLYDAGSYRPLISDIKAFRIDDVLTVQVYENATASSSADTGTRRGNTLHAGVTSLSGHNRQVGLETNGDFDGGGRTQRASRLLTTITVSVKEVMPNGDLRVAGTQMLTVNEEPQRVTLEGRVRREDISDNNVVLSTRLADARISYVGEGDLAERNRRPWWRKFLDWSGF